MRLFLLFIVATQILLASCKKNGPAEAAFFLRVNNVSVATTSKQGTSSHKITDLWLYVNGKFQGAYPVGHLMPVVSKNEAVRLNIFAGIKNNGISGTRIYSEFYEILQIDTLVENGKTVTRDLTFKYNPAVTFPWTENFEGGVSGISLRKSDNSYTTFHLATPDNCFEGRSIELGLSGDSLVAQIESISAFNLPTGAANVYLELNYKGNDDFLVGLIGDDGTSKGALFVRAQESWNKIYIQLATAVNDQPVSDKYKVFFRLQKYEIENPKIFLDNIKLVYLQ